MKTLQLSILSLLLFWTKPKERVQKKSTSFATLDFSITMDEIMEELEN